MRDVGTSHSAGGLIPLAAFCKGRPGLSALMLTPTVAIRSAKQQPTQSPRLPVAKGFLKTQPGTLRTGQQDHVAVKNIDRRGYADWQQVPTYFQTGLTRILVLMNSAFLNAGPENVSGNNVDMADEDQQHATGFKVAIR